MTSASKHVCTFPRKAARRQRAAERLAAHKCGPTCKRFRKAPPEAEAA